MLLFYVLLFIVFSFIGWIIDSSYRSIVLKKWINAGYFRGPVCPVYGFGGLLLVIMFKIFSSMDIYLLILLSSIGMVVIEYFAGAFSVKFLKVTLWDYSKARFNLHGHVDLVHSFYWIILVLIFYYAFYSFVLMFEKLIVVSFIVDWISLFVFVVLSLWLLIRRMKR